MVWAKLCIDKHKSIYISDHEAITFQLNSYVPYKVFNLYRKARNDIDSALSKAHQKYCCHLFDDTFTENCKRFWSLIKRLRKDYQPVAPLRVDGELKISPLFKAEALNKQFSQYLLNIPIMNSNSYPGMPHIAFTTNGIERLLQDLKPGMAPGQMASSHGFHAPVKYTYSRSDIYSTF